MTLHGNAGWGLGTEKRKSGRNKGNLKKAAQVFKDIFLPLMDYKQRRAVVTRDFRIPVF